MEVKVQCKRKAKAAGKGFRPFCNVMAVQIIRLSGFTHCCGCIGYTQAITRGQNCTFWGTTACHWNNNFAVARQSN